MDRTRSHYAFKLSTCLSDRTVLASRIIEAISLLRGTAKDLRGLFGKDRGGVSSWIWKGAPEAATSVEALIRSPHSNHMPLRHHLAFGAPDFMFTLSDERIENERPFRGETVHPDLLPKLADLLKDASQRTQLIVTTHSDILVSAMTDMPEVVVVCEKHEGRTVMKRLDREDLKEWLKRYRLGDLWTRGELGGTRW